MNIAEILQSHLFEGEPRSIKQDNLTIIYQCCSNCGRDFGYSLESEELRAIYIGIFRVEFLADTVNERWLQEPCPLKFLVNDNKDRILFK